MYFIGFICIFLIKKWLTIGLGVETVILFSSPIYRTRKLKTNLGVIFDKKAKTENKDGIFIMSVTINKPISKEKELFLAICLLAGEISSQTIRRMKVDYGISKVKNAIIQPLAKRGYIFKVGTKSNYGYHLTNKGLEYLKIKVPNKYNYDVYTDSNAYVYKTPIRERARQSSMVLYTLAREGIDIGNHYSEARNIINGYKEKIERPFFITPKVMWSLNYHLQGIYGSRVYGFVFTAEKIIAVYAPDKEHNLLARSEKSLADTITNILSEAAIPPYNNQHNYEVLYLYNTFADTVESFSVKDKINAKQPITKRVYDIFKYKNSYIYFMDKNPYSLWDVIDNTYRSEIDEIFKRRFRLADHKIKGGNSIYIRNIYENELPTVICWTLNPASIQLTMTYCREEIEKGDRVLFICFSEQEPVLRKILDINKTVSSRIDVLTIDSKSVYDYIEGKITEIL